MLNIPPVGQAIAVALGVTLAIIRLLTASKPFWGLLPNKLQKALPAAFVALGLLPAALGQAKTWLDIVTAVILVIGTYFTASRGDQKPPKDVGGGPRTDRVDSDPKLTRDELESEPPSLPGVRLSSLIPIALVSMLGCSGVPKNPQHPDPACSDERYAELMGDCGAKAAACVAKGGAEKDCGAVCDGDADRWQEKCQ